MRIRFFGAARQVTGSCHCIECGGARLLVDCGLQQGRDEIDENALPFHAGGIDALVVTHAHIDHTGRIPLLVKEGFRGPIFCTRLTGELMGIMLRDSAHIQESDAQWQNQKGRRAGRPEVPPLYTLADAEAALQLIRPVEYGQEFEILPGVRGKFSDAGHLLGSACLQLWLEENGAQKKLLFTGDLGNVDQPIIRDPQTVDTADYLITESTYGDRNHTPPESYTQALADLITSVFSKGGNVIIPSFAVGRTQELLYFIREMKEENLVPDFPDFPVYVDSPLAYEATKIFSGDLHGYLDEEAIAVLQGGDQLFTFPGLCLARTGEESKALNQDPTPKVIISASGMCDAGRIRHHLKHNLWRSNCAVVFVGYQAEGSLGRRLLDGAKTVKLFGEEIAVEARVVNFPGLSSHADHDHLLAWTQALNPPPKTIFVVHGEDDVAQRYAGELTSLGLSAHAPLYQEVYDLAEDCLVEPGMPIPAKKSQAPGKVSAAYRRLEDTVAALTDLVRRRKGAPNKDLAKLADQLKALMEKWDS